MIRILAREYSKAVATLCAKLDQESADYDLYLSQNSQLLGTSLVNGVNCDGLVLVGDTGRWSTYFAETFGLALVYSKHAEENVKDYFKHSNLPQPTQYMLDKYCTLPEAFVHYPSVFGYQGGMAGEYGRCRHVYILPDDVKECEVLFDNYIAKDMFRERGRVTKYTFKIFGLSKRDLEKRLAKIPADYVSQRCETTNLDSTVTLTFANKCPKKAITAYVQEFTKAFESYLYSDSGASLAQTAVSLLNERMKTVAVAESITGGMLASSLVDVPGASTVLYEGVVSYTIDSKCSRLGLNPHFIDEYGVVSPQVAKEMAYAQLKRADYSVATTGFAGPTADGKSPVGLCYVGIGFKQNGKSQVKVFKNVFSGDRNSIRAQVANTALYLLINTLKK